MARCIMADKEGKVASPASEQSTKTKFNPTIRNINTLNNDHNSSGVDAAAPSSPSCSCTKISTMQLFYEMKQKFPAVPDNVVCEIVNFGQNCHNRSACIDCLEDYPNNSATNVYPQALRNQPIKKKTSTATKNPTTAPGIELNQQQQHQHKQSTESEQMTNPIEAINRPIPPNTLNLKNLNCYAGRVVNRPTRQAPPPPTNTPCTGAAPAATTPTTQQSTKSLLTKPVNLSVNVIVSPLSRPSSSQQSQSHYSFTLHQPNTCVDPDVQCAAETTTTNTQLPAVAAAKAPTTVAQFNVPSLTYTSSAYDTDIGYQSRLEITVAGTSSKSTENCDQLNDNAADATRNISLTRSIDNQQLPSVVASAEFLEESMYGFCLIVDLFFHVFPCFFFS